MPLRSPFWSKAVSWLKPSVRVGDGGPELEDIDDEDGEGGQDLKKKIEGKNAQVKLSISCVALKLGHMCGKIYTNHVDTACLKYNFFPLPPFEIRYQKKFHR